MVWVLLISHLHEQQSEGCENGLALELIAGAGAARQRSHEDAVDEPVRPERRRDRQRHAQNRVDAEEGEHPERRKSGGHQKLAIGEIHDARHSILQVESHGDERVQAAQNDAAEYDFDHRHVRRRRPVKPA
jgi:hypothetical protein